MTQEEIIAGLWMKNEDALEMMIRQYTPLCRKIAGGLLGREDTEEVLADTWMRVWDSIPPNRPASLGAYAGRITRNLTVNRYRMNHAACRDSDVLTDWEALTESPELFETVQYADPVAETVEEAALMEAVTAFLKTLKQNDRVLFVRRYYFLEDGNTLADLFGTNPHHIHVKLARLREKLRRYLEGRHFL